MALNDDIARIAHQESGLVFPRFLEQEAWDLGSRLRAWGAERQWPIVVDIRRFDRPLFYAALAGSTPDNVEWVRRKSNTVTRFHRSSYRVGLELRAADETLESRFGLSTADFAVHGGAFPITVEGAGIVGSVTVSGLPQRDDHALVIRALCAALARREADFELPPED